MNKRIIQVGITTIVALASFTIASAVKSPVPTQRAIENVELDKLVGQPVDISPWGYLWSADMDVQKKAEAYFIPRRLERIDNVYRTACDILPPDQLKSIYHNQLDLLKQFPPKPKGQLLTGLLWTGRLVDYQIQLQWPIDVKVPSPEAVQVRVYPTSWGWFGWTVDKILSDPEISEDLRTWTYKSEPGAKMDWAYSKQVDAATEMVAVFYDENKDETNLKSVVPSIRLTSANVGTWERMDLPQLENFSATNNIPVQTVGLLL